MRLEIECYCEQCPYFRPDIIDLRGADGYVDRVIFCEDREKCKFIEKHLKADPYKDSSSGPNETEVYKELSGSDKRDLVRLANKWCEKLGLTKCEDAPENLITYLKINKLLDLKNTHIFLENMLRKD